MEAPGGLVKTLSLLAGSASIEATPREVAELTNAWGTATRGARVYLTRLPGDSFAATLRAAKLLRRKGFAPVPHIAARMIENEAALAAELALLTSEAGVEEVLLVAGSVAQPAGAFSNTMQVLATGAFERAGVSKIGVAAHPEGHPQVPDLALQAAIDWKNAYARSTGARLYFVTQFFFDARPVIAWERRIRARGNGLPVRIGVHGVTNAASLLRRAMHCGVGPSAKLLTQRPGDVLQLATARTPRKILIELAGAMLADKDSRFCGLHFFPLGGLARTIAWVDRLREGVFEAASDV